jgi:glycerol 2-dehydrogenase (NADP+)
MADNFSLAVTNGRSVLAKSVTPSRIEENLTIVELEEDDRKELVSLVEGVKRSKGFRRYVYPDFGVDFGFPDRASKE